MNMSSRSYLRYPRTETLLSIFPPDESGDPNGGPREWVARFAVMLREEPDARAVLEHFLMLGVGPLPDTGDTAYIPWSRSPEPAGLLYHPDFARAWNTLVWSVVYESGRMESLLEAARDDRLYPESDRILDHGVYEELAARFLVEEPEPAWMYEVGCFSPRVRKITSRATAPPGTPWPVVFETAIGPVHLQGA